MAESVKDAFGRTFRNFQLDGIPASGVNQVSKSEARQLGALLDDKLAAASVGDLEAAEALLAPMVAEATAAAEAAQAVADPAVGAAIKIDDLWAQRERRALTDTDAIAPEGGDSWGTGHYIWAVAKGVTESGPIKALRTRIQDLAGTAVTIRAEVYRLPADLTAFPIPVDLGDYELVSTTDTPAIELLGARRIAADQIGADIPLGGQVELAGRKLLIVVSALDGGGARVQINLARGDLGGGEDAWLRGIYSDDATGTPTYQIPPSGMRALGQLLADTAAAIPAGVMSAAAAVSERTQCALGVGWQGQDSWRAGSGFRELAIAIHVARTVRAKAVAPLVLDLNLADTIHYRIYRRPAGLALTAAPGVDSRDQLLAASSIAVADAAATPTSPDAQALTLPFEHLMDPAWVYLVNWSATNAGAVVGVGLATGDNAVSDNDADTNLFWYALGSNQRALAAIAGQRGAWSLIEAAASPDFGLLPATPTVRSLETTLRRPGRTLNLPGCELARLGGALVIPPQTVTITDISSETITETLTVQPYNGNTVWASRRHLTALTVEKDGSPLTAGTDYGMEMRTGLVQVFASGAPYDVELTFTGYKTRYDLIWADPVTGEIGVTEGTARGRDPEEYLPALPAGKVALWHVHVTPGAMELLPVHRFRNMVEIGREAEFQSIREHNQRCLPGLSKRMRSGTAFPLLGTGDSITEIADASEPEVQLDPNTGRDGLRYLQGAIPADTIAANVARFNEDGTPNASGPIIHIGWNYALKAAIEARSDCVVTYYNLGIGGTTAAATLSGSGLYNGGHPDRLAAGIATGAKLAVIAFGMNQLGDAAIFSQVVAIVNAYKAAGMECIILTVPGTNVFGPSGNTAAIDKWRATNDHLVRAALATDTAYVPLHLVTGVGQEAALGISRESFSSANAINHDGPYVMKKLGQFLAMMVTP